MASLQSLIMKKNLVIGVDAKRAYQNASGLGNYSRDLIRILAQRKPHWIFKLFTPKEKTRFEMNALPNVQKICPKSFWGRFFRGAWRSLGITQVAKEQKLDLYHGLSGEIPYGISAKIPTIVTIHDLIFLRYPQLYSFFDRKIHNLKFKYAVNKASHIIAISEQTKRDIVDYYGIEPSKISVIYQGCNQAYKRQATQAQKDSVRQKYDLPAEFVLNVGTIEARKNALSIVKAIKDLDISLVLVGRKTKYFKQIEAFVNKHHMQHRVRVLSGVSVEDLAVIYQLASVFCYPSIFEGFGIPIIEALFSQTPVITTLGGCFPEAGGEDSMYIRLENAPAEIKNCIEELRANPARRTQMVKKGLRYAQRFEDDAVAEALLKVYTQVIEK